MLQILIGLPTTGNVTYRLVTTSMSVKGLHHQVQTILSILFHQRGSYIGFKFPALMIPDVWVYAV